MRVNALVACLVVAGFLNTAESVAAPGVHHGRAASEHKARHKGHSHDGSSLRTAAAVSATGHSKATAGHRAAAWPVAAKPLTIAIDAGHGGKDTGAIGYNGTYEKDVVYAIARRLEGLVRAGPGMRAVMVRRGDVFIPLRRRAEIARRAGADLFISIHADAHADGDAKGSAVFTLLPRKQEAESFGEDTLKVSDRAAGKILGEMRKRQAVHYRHVQKARFAVLKSPDVPSLLIETGFVSNPEEERNLSSPAYQERIARSIFNGVSAYFRMFRPAQAMAVKGKGVDLALGQ